MQNFYEITEEGKLELLATRERRLSICIADKKYQISENTLWNKPKDELVLQKKNKILSQHHLITLCAIGFLITSFKSLCANVLKIICLEYIAEYFSIPDPADEETINQLFDNLKNSSFIL